MTIQAISTKIKRIFYSTMPIKKDSSSMKAVCTAYELILQRPIDADGKSYWQDQIKNGTFLSHF